MPGVGTTEPGDMSGGAREKSGHEEADVCGNIPSVVSGPLSLGTFLDKFLIPPNIRSPGLMSLRFTSNLVCI